ncbi:transglutaminase family protein [Frankia sp. QA3]|uniref:transglutaminase-like domain-containing protein n=1 Tax=Frankia sp. QA3 TaxID=710111 RepID=UPI000269C65D|nr:transglutaminase family protein [Frankia sp. QA3]EIV93566.1 transglutaminase-like enzyme, predicted cysteine protease [Frankia sp. QA3]
MTNDTTASAGRETPRPAGDDDPGRVVTCDLAFDVQEPADIALQIAAAERGGRTHEERLDLATGGTALAPPVELAAPHGGRIHLLRAPRGLFTASYRAHLDRPRPRPRAAPIPDGAAGDEPLDLQRLTYLRPSRYCPSDHVVGLAVAEFGALPQGRPRVDAIADWIHHRIGYVAGSSTVHDTAEDTLLTGQGVCRDFAHLGVTLCRALGIPARFTAVYAPGLTPMDFHAVFEAWTDGAWHVHDPTRRVPRGGLIRIATGRDAADTAFATVLGGIATLRSVEVTATVTGLLPTDDHRVEARLG